MCGPKFSAPPLGKHQGARFLDCVITVLYQMYILRIFSQYCLLFVVRTEWQFPNSLGVEPETEALLLNFIS